MCSAERAWRAAATLADALGDLALRDARSREADRCAAVERSREGHPGHAWRTGPWDRSCVRCGMVVRSICEGREKLRRIERSDGPTVVVLDGDDVALPPCRDGAVGQYETAVAAAPWRHV